jgi:mono/diheme cytochrome c family protein
MEFRHVAVSVLAALVATVISAGGADAQSSSGKPGTKSDYWRDSPMPPRHWGREPMGPMFRSRILRQRTFMQGRYPAFYKGLKNPLPKTRRNIALGRGLFQLHCETCHGAKGLGAGESAKGLTPSPALLAFMIKLPESVDPYLMWTIAEGGRPFGTEMPAFKNRLAANQIWQILIYMRAGFPN